MKRILTFAAALAVLALVAAAPGLTQEDVRLLAAPAFAPARRAPVPFNHDQHNAAGNIEACNTCHHAYQDGRLAPDDDSVGMACADCHAADGNSPVHLMNAYHRQCSGCHEQSGKGPVMCGECHPRE